LSWTVIGRTRRWGRRWGALVLAAAAFLAAGATPAGAVGRAAVDLAPLPGYTGSYARGVNAAGMVVGDSVAGRDRRHATLWRPAAGRGYAAIDLGALPGRAQSSAKGINDAGVVVGGSASEPDLLSHAVVWTPDGHGAYAIADLTPGADSETFSEADSVNSAGAVAGAMAASFAAPSHAVVWLRGGSGGRTMVDLGARPDGATVASWGLAVNPAAVVVGSRDNRASLWRRGSGGAYAVVDLAAPPGSDTNEARGISPAAGIVVGESSGPGAFGRRAAVWELAASGAYVATVLGSLPGGSGSQAWGVGRTGDVVGSSDLHATLWRRAGQGRYTPVDLGSFPDGGHATAVSRTGWVAGDTGTGLSDHALVWSP
jgi:uncharacterized membrane protein